MVLVGPRRIKKMEVHLGRSRSGGSPGFFGDVECCLFLLTNLICSWLFAIMVRPVFSVMSFGF